MSNDGQEELHPAQNDYRREMRARRMGLEPVCVACGESDPVAMHHVGGRHNDADLEGPLCFNCHARVHERMREVGARLDRDRSKAKLERLEAVLRGLAAFLLLLASSLLGWAQFLADLVRELDRSLPDWRSMEVSY